MTKVELIGVYRLPKDEFGYSSQLAEFSIDGFHGTEFPCFDFEPGFGNTLRSLFDVLLISKDGTNRLKNLHQGDCVLPENTTQFRFLILLRDSNDKVIKSPYGDFERVFSEFPSRLEGLFEVPQGD